MNNNSSSRRAANSILRGGGKHRITASNSIPSQSSLALTYRTEEQSFRAPLWVGQKRYRATKTSDRWVSKFPMQILLMIWIIYNQLQLNTLLKLGVKADHLRSLGLKYEHGERVCVKNHSKYNIHHRMHF